MTSDTSFGDIFAAFLAHCPPIGRLEPPFAFLDPPPDCYGPIADPHAALADLRHSFTDERLRDCGILRPGPHGQYRLAPALVRQRDPIVPIRPGHDLPPRALLVGRWCLPVHECPMTLALNDSARAGATTVPLFAVADTTELVLYRALGVPSTLASGLRPPSFTALQGLADAQAAQAPKLVFVDGSFRQMSVRPSRHIRFTVKHLATARERLLFDFPMRGWQLNDDFLALWRYLLTFRERSVLVKWLTENAADLVDFEDLIGRVPDAVAQPPSYEQARLDRLAGPQVGADGLPSLHSHWNYDTALNTDIIQPLIARAQSIADPVHRATQIELAEELGLLAQFRQNLSVVLNQGRMPVKEIKNYLALAAHVARGMRDSDFS